jgi:hypothetical protein
MHSIVFLPESDGECAGVLISSCQDYAAAARIATSILGAALVRVDTVRLEDDDGLAAAASIAAHPAGGASRRRDAALSVA